MRSELGERIRQARLVRGWTRQEVARRLGYRNVNRGARRLERLERTGAPDDLVDALAPILGIDALAVAELRARDEAAREAALEAWLREPQPVALYGYAAGVTFLLPIPEGLTEEQAIEHAVTLHQKRRIRMCLALDRRRSLWIERDGRQRMIEASRGRPNHPYTTIG